MLSIPKTVVYVDSVNGTIMAVEAMRRELIEHKGASPVMAKNAVSNFHSHMGEDDKSARFDEFRKSDSRIRIMVATTSLGTGINITDIDRIFVFGFSNREKRPRRVAKGRPRWSKS